MEAPAMMLDHYRAAFEQEFRASGRKPDVAILGSTIYDTLQGELKTYFGTGLKIPTRETLKLGGSSFQYEGVHIFRCCAAKTTMLFAALEEKEVEFQPQGAQRKEI